MPDVSDIKQDMPKGEKPNKAGAGKKGKTPSPSKGDSSPKGGPAEEQGGSAGSNKANINPNDPKENKLPSISQGSDNNEDGIGIDEGNKIGRTAGKYAGKTAGAAVGSVVPVVGTAVGELVGGIVGEIAGNFVENVAKIIGMILFIVMICAGAMLQKVIPGSLENNQTTRYANDVMGGHDKATETTTFEGGDNSLKKFDRDYPLEYGLLTYIDGIKGKKDTGLKDAMDKAISEKSLGIVLALGSSEVSKLNVWNFWASLWKKLQTWLKLLGRELRGYNLEESLKTFYENPWPYDRGNAKIGDFLKSRGVTKYTEKYRSDFVPKYDDVNWIEMLSVMSMNTKFSWDNINYDEFNKHIHSDKAQFDYFEMSVQWVAVYRGAHTIQKGTDANGNPITETCTHIDKDHFVEWDEKKLCDAIKARPSYSIYCPKGRCWVEMKPAYYFCRIKVKPFGLKELYDLAEVDPNGYYQVSSSDGRSDGKAPGDEGVSFYRHTNAEMLDRCEEWTRTYLRGKESMFAISVGGPPYDEDRDKRSPIYKDLLEGCGHPNQPKKWNKKATGRSNWYYLANGIQTYKQNIIDPNAELMTMKTPEASPDIKKIVDSLDDLTDNQKKIIEIVLQYCYSAQGALYSQERRMENGWYDCSSLAERAYQAAGFSTIGSYSKGEYNWGINNGCILPASEAKLIPGCVIIQSSTASPSEIHHVSVYVGDGYIIEATGHDKNGNPLPVSKMPMNKKKAIAAGNYWVVYPWLTAP